jgi:hypothetical protein
MTLMHTSDGFGSARSCTPIRHLGKSTGDRNKLDNEWKRNGWTNDLFGYH